MDQAKLLISEEISKVTIDYSLNVEGVQWPNI